jgi:hypothetical protein
MAGNMYNVDLIGPVTPLMVRDAVVECFWDAHCKDSGMGEIDANTNRSYCKAIVQKAFADSQGDFEHPTKESIIKCLDALATFAKAFRDPAIIQKHYSDIMLLVNKLS